MPNSSYGALRQLQSKFHKIKTFQQLKTALQEQDLRAFLSLRTVGYESVQVDLIGETFSNLERLFVDVTILDKEKTLLSNPLQVEAYPRKCNLSDLEYIWLKALRNVMA